MRDRLTEFKSVASTFDQQQIHSRSQTRARPPKREPSAFSQEFTDFARRLFRDMADTQNKLEKLSMLASRGGIYNDNTVEIQELTYFIKQDLARLSGEIQKLKELVAANMSRRRTHFDAHADTIVSMLGVHLGDASTKFKSVLEMRKVSLKKAKKRREEFSFDGSAYNPAANAGMSTLLQGLSAAEVQDGGKSGDVSLDIPDMGYQDMAMVANQERYIQERADAMETIEATIHELGSMFKEIGSMVASQGEQVSRIDQTMDSALANTESAHNELVKHFEGMSSNKWLMMKIFAFLSLFFIFFVVVIA